MNQSGGLSWGRGIWLVCLLCLSVLFSACGENQNGEVITHEEIGGPQNPTPVRVHRNYRDGKLHGLATYYWAGGDGKGKDSSGEFTIKLQEVSWDNGKLSGPTTSYYDDGKKLAVFNYIDGLTHGDCYLYFDDGRTVEEKKVYDKGKLVSTINYFKNGKPKLETTFRDNQRHGVQKEYHKEGPLRRTRTYHGGMLHGMETYYYVDSNVAATIEYAKGLRSGKARSFYPNGKLMEEITYDRNDPKSYKAYGLDGTPLKDGEAISKEHPDGYTLEDIIQID